MDVNRLAAANPRNRPECVINAMPADTRHFMSREISKTFPDPLLFSITSRDTLTPSLSFNNFASISLTCEWREDTV